jgi:hypothetical protein
MQCICNVYNEQLILFIFSGIEAESTYTVVQFSNEDIYYAFILDGEWI